MGLPPPRMVKTVPKWKEQAHFQKSFKKVVLDDSRNRVTTRYIGADGSITKTKTLARTSKLPFPILAEITLSPPSDDKISEESDPSSAGEDVDAEDEDHVDGDKDNQTQTSKTINKFMQEELKFVNLLLSRFGNTRKEELCKCKEGLRVVRCSTSGCFQRESTCIPCFVRSHRNTPLHWPMVWSSEEQYWEKRDYSTLSDDAVYHLGHTEDDDPCPNNESIHDLTIIHSNGIHHSNVRYCGCLDAEDSVTQLMRAGLFPGTVADPKTAYTFDVLEEFHLHNLQSKCGAFDFMMTLRRLTDDVRTSKVSNPYKGFLRVTRVWDYFNLKIRSGQIHNIDSCFPNRPTGNIILYCPACPEPGVNMPSQALAIPDDLRHVSSLYLTIDGNFHANRYRKNSDPNDRSLWDGKGYFPSRADYQDYLGRIPVSKEKSVCNYINAVNSQDQKKFRGMDETGLINVQCSHVFINYCVDMYFGERFAYTDYALAQVLSARASPGVDINVSYDSACSYSVNVESRFRDNFSELLEIVRRIFYSIDYLHINDHTDKCIYVFGACYMMCTGHFHAVGTEQFWSEGNQMGPQTRQMNPGHRQDKIIEHHTDWNTKKQTKLTATLVKALLTAWVLYVEKRDYFRKLSELHAKMVPEWYPMDPSTTITDEGEVLSIYKHTSSKAISLSSALMSLNSKWKPSLDNPSSPSSYFLLEGIDIQSKQLSLQGLLARYKAHGLLATQKEIGISRDNLTVRLHAWREQQLIHMPTIHFMTLSQSSLEVQEERLFLPSDFTIADRSRLSLEALASEEVLLRQGQASETIMQLRRTMKTLSILGDQKRKHIKGQKPSTRAQGQRMTVEFTRDSFLRVYSACRDALESLGALESSASQNRFPRLTRDDLYRKSTRHKRKLGDTHRTDGLLWVLGGSSAESSSANDPSEQELLQPHGTPRASSISQHSSDLVLAPSASASSSNKGTEPTLWSPVVGLSEDEVVQWEIEEDRVQWHRARAEMMRWLEEFELKHVEMIRTIQTFYQMQQVWLSLASKSSEPGYIGYAHQQASIYAKLHADAKDLFSRKAESRLASMTYDNMIQTLREFRNDELLWLRRVAKVGEEDMGSSSISTL